MILCLEPLPLKTNIKLSNNKTRNILLCRTDMNRTYAVIIIIIITTTTTSTVII